MDGKPEVTPLYRFVKHRRHKYHMHFNFMKDCALSVNKLQEARNIILTLWAD